MINAKQNGDTLTVFLTGRISSVNAADVENEINAAISPQTYKELALDCSGLEYLSSAGLRIVLRLRKSHAAFKVINVSTEIYELFEMTGFTQMMDVQKACRELSVEGCEVIGEGANGRVYRIDPETIVKVFESSESIEDIQRERELARKAFIKGIPTAISFDVVRVGDSYGSVFELLNAESFANILIRDPGRLDELAGLFAGLLKKIHATEFAPGELPEAKTVTLRRIEILKSFLPAAVFEKLVSLVSAIPDNYHMIHGDYHVKNIMLQGGEAMLIDMDTVCVGNPVFELGHMYNSLLGYSDVVRDNVLGFLGIPYETAEAFWNRALRDYLGTDDEDVFRSVEKKAKIIGYSRVMNRFIRHGCMDTPRSKAEIENCQRQFARLLPEVDELAL